MSNMKEILIEAKGFNEKQKTLNIAKVLITFAIYLITAGTLIEYVSIPFMLKMIGFMLAAHAFFFLWKSSKYDY